MRVVIVGAGISGLALALGLQHRGHDVTVIEEADGLRTGGAALALWYNGRAALANLGCDLNSVGCTIELLDIRSSNGRLACRIDAARLSRRFGFEPLTIGRGELIEELASHLGSGTVLFGAPCRGVDQPGSSARVFLDGGSYLDADLVVGADGHRSVMRRLFASPVPATPTGWSALQGLTRAPLPLAEGTTSTFVAGRGGAVGLMPAGQGLLQWWFDVRWPPEP
ncbi:MAG: FAD-dependent oxidoreductase, partial [Acidimicrobiales bacterium]